MSKFLIVGEFMSRNDHAAGKPFSGGTGKFLFSMLNRAGISPSDCTFTTAFSIFPQLGDIKPFFSSTPNPGALKLSARKWLTPVRMADVTRLREQIETTHPRLIIALGAAALFALIEDKSIDKWRGAPILSPDGYKILPTYSPMSIMNKATHFPVAVADLIKAKREAEFREIRRPSRILWLNPTLADFEKFYTEHIVPAPIVSIDIETNARTITEISFAVSPSLCLVVPFYSHEKVNYWSTISEELAAWSLVRKIFSTKKILGQNFQYDALFSYLSLGIPSPHYTEDTMYLHHTLEPELRKGLGFLASIYTDEPAWKFMRKDATDKLAG